MKKRLDLDVREQIGWRPRSSPSSSQLAAIEALLTLLMARRGKTAIANLTKSEDQLCRFGAYWGPNSTSRRR